MIFITVFLCIALGLIAAPQPTLAALRACRLIAILVISVLLVILRSARSSVR
jgi:hypothetical protein